jgi:predicted TIM-barrel fold metal-dependent hydrolase
MDYSPTFIQELVRAVGIRKMMYGTDTPYWVEGARQLSDGLPPVGNCGE